MNKLKVFYENLGNMVLKTGDFVWPKADFGGNRAQNDKVEAVKKRDSIQVMIVVRNQGIGNRAGLGALVVVRGFWDVNYRA